MKKLLASSLVGAAVLAAASSASAGDFTPAFEANRAGGFIDLWPSRSLINDNTNFEVIFGAELQFRVAKKVFLDMSFSGAYVDYDNSFFGVGGRYQQAAYGNPTFGAYYATDVTPNFAFYIGGDLTLPLLHDPDAKVAGAAAEASIIRGYWDADRFSPGYVAVRAKAGIEWEIVRHFYFRADLRPVVYINSNSKYRSYGFGFGNADGHFFLEQDVEIEYRLNNGFGFGARLQGVALFTENDKFQLMAEPFIALTPKTRGFFLRVGFPFALDENLGFGFDRGKLATIKLALGGQW